MPAPTRARRARPTRPLACHKCGSPRVVVDSDTDYATRGGKRRITASAGCARCRHLWQSVHPDAVTAARAKRAAFERAADAEARG